MKIFFSFIALSAFCLSVAATETKPKLVDIVMTEQRNRELERLFAPRRLPSIEIRGGLLSPIVDNSAFADTLIGDMEDLLIFGNDVAAKYRGGYRISPHGTLYVKGGLMYGRDGSNFSYGVLTVHHHTGPAVRWKW